VIVAASSEIIENLVRVADQAEIYLEWSVNEKVAQETAAVSFAGLRALCAMKQNGVICARMPSCGAARYEPSHTSVLLERFLSG
jgi:TPP-dependent indolepyruvate ferredoxin oxidoreductase alpha subunit